MLILFVCPLDYMLGGWWERHGKILAQRWLLPFTQIALGLSIHLTVAASVERRAEMIRCPSMTLKCDFFRYMTICRNRSDRFSFFPHYVVPVLALAVLFHVPKFFEFELQLVEADGFVSNQTHLTLAPSDLRVDSGYIFWYLIVFNLLVQFVFPLLALAFLNWRVAIVIFSLGPSNSADDESNAAVAAANGLASGVEGDYRPFRRPWGREHRLAFMLMIVVAIFAFCHCFRFVINIMEVTKTHDVCVIIDWR